MPIPLGERPWPPIIAAVVRSLVQDRVAAPQVTLARPRAHIWWPTVGDYVGMGCARAVIHFAICISRRNLGSWIQSHKWWLASYQIALAQSMALQGLRQSMTEQTSPQVVGRRMPVQQSYMAPGDQIGPQRNSGGSQVGPTRCTPHTTLIKQGHTTGPGVAERRASSMRIERHNTSDLAHWQAWPIHTCSRRLHPEAISPR